MSNTPNSRYVMPGRNTPWRVPGYRYGPGVFALHQEIEQFYAYIMPTPVEHAARIEVLQRIEAAILSLWPKATLEVFGSFRTGMYLPTSDVDIVVFGLWEKLPLRTLEKDLTARGIVEPNTVRIIDSATVPIVKVVDARYKIKVDISFNLQGGIQSAELIKKFKREYPPLPKLVIVIKQFLLQRDLNEVFSGGLSSYALNLLVISFFQLHPRRCDLSKINLGVYLVEFFELYGRRFNYDTLGIGITNGGKRAPKKEFERNTHSNHSNSPLCIEDPVSPGNIIGRRSYNFAAVQRSFAYGYIMLATAINPNNELAKQTQEKSILARIVHIDHEVIKYRQWISNIAADLVVKESTTSLPTANVKESKESTAIVRTETSKESVEDNDPIVPDVVIVSDDCVAVSSISNQAALPGPSNINATRHPHRSENPQNNSHSHSGSNNRNFASRHQHNSNRRHHSNSKRRPPFRRF